MYCKWCRQEKDEKLSKLDGEPICEECLKAIPFPEEEDGGYFDDESYTGIG